MPQKEQKIAAASLVRLAERNPQESSVSSDSRIASIFFMLSSYDSLLFLVISSKGFVRMD